MYCGIDKKGKCIKVSKKHRSSRCKLSRNKKKCIKKTIRGKPKKPKPKEPKSDKPKPIIDKEDLIEKPKNEYKEVNYRCPSDKVYNSKTKRCIKKTSSLGKKIMISNQTKIIGGPISISYYKFKVGNVERKILLLGDEHTQYKHHQSPDTIEITTLLKKIIRKSPYCIDFFSENAPYHEDLKARGKALQRYDSPLDAIRDEFGKCPVHHLPGAKCDFNNLRYHNWDLRMQASKIETVRRWKSNPYDDILFYKRIFDNINKRFNTETIIRYILGFKTDKKAKLDEFFDEEIDSKMDLNGIFAEDASTKDLLQKRQGLIQKEYKKCMKSVRFPKNFLDIFISSYKSMKDIDYTLVFTDFYMLCRMFMNFNTNKERAGKGCPIKKYKTPQYIIVYAGDQHILHLKSFFKKMFQVDPVYKSGCHTSKKIHLYQIKTHNNKSLMDVKTVDDLFRDFYE